MSVLSRERIRERLRGFEFERLFVEDLGWNRFPGRGLAASVDGGVFELHPVAEKRGFGVYRCPPDAVGAIPAYEVRRKIERQVAKSAHEHLVIYVDASSSTQVWQWVRREAGQPTACREHVYRKGQTGEALVQRLQGLAFALAEEEKLTIVGVADRARATFDVERVTKRFYERFKEEHAAFLKLIKGIDEDGDREWYASVMLNRLMFVYFIQRKGFLDGDTNYLRNRLGQCQKERGRDKFYSFYRHFLLQLFHQGFGSRKRTADLDRLLGKIPYLNGGLFEVHALETPDRYGEKIEISDKAFVRAFDYFDQYQWHLDERPLRSDNEINPDVLGYIFEKYINQKQMGAYYTREDITGYICSNTVIPALLDAARERCAIAFDNPRGPTVWSMLQVTPERYVSEAMRHGQGGDLPKDVAVGCTDPGRRGAWNKRAAGSSGLPGETWREAVRRRSRCDVVMKALSSGMVQDVTTAVTLNLDLRQFAQDIVESCEGPELLRAVWEALEQIRVLDPTCGSGAFLFAALNVLEPLYEACLSRMEAFVADDAVLQKPGQPERYPDFRAILERVEVHQNPRYFILKSIILNNLFGVDVMEEAAEICKLRLFLKLVAQVEPSAEKDNFGIEPLPDIDFNIRSGNSLVGFARYEDVAQTVTSTLDFDNAMQKLSTRARELQEAFDAFRREQTAGTGAVSAEQKAELQARVRVLETELNRYLADSYGVKRSDRAAHDKWLESHQPFHWFVDFFGIMNGGGFDVIIGNPPYVEYRKVKDAYRLPTGQYRSETADNLYAFCVERACRLASARAWFGMIVPAGLLGLDETLPLRELLLERFNHAWFSTYAIRPSKLFDGVDQRLCINLATTRAREDAEIWTTRYRHWTAEERPHLFSTLEYAPSFMHPRLKRIPQIGSQEAASILKRLEGKQTRTVAYYFGKKGTGALMHYHRSPRYWIRAMDFEQYFKSPTRTRSVHHFRDIYFREKSQGRFIGGILNSSLFFFWFLCVGNGRNITGTDVEQFPVGEVNQKSLLTMGELFDRLMKDYKKNSFVRERQDCEFQEFRPSMSKAIVDEMDVVLAAHFGFEAEELDYLVNYEVKYRMGQEEDED